MQTAQLQDRSIVTISGEDRFSFLQGLITNDVKILEQGKPLYAAMLSPQGKFLHDFIIIPQAECLWIDIHRAHAEDFLKRLNMYKLRAKVAFERLRDMAVMAAWGDGLTVTGIYIEDPRLQALGMRVYGAKVVDAGGDYEAHRIRYCVPDGAQDMQAGVSLLLQFRFEYLHGVSFSKGCYVGQEVTARSKFIGNVRKHLYAVTAAEELPALGTPVMCGDAEAGELRSTRGTFGIALLKDEILAQAAPTANGISLICRVPEWAKED